MFKHVVRGSFFAGLSLASMLACGGSSTSGSGPDGGAGSGGSAAGGSGGTAATGAVGGGGSGGGVSGSGGAGTGGGSGGNAFAACDGPGQCFLFPTNCCGYCGEPKLEGFIGVNHNKSKEANNFYCADPVACPDCVEFPQPNLIALCEAGQCTPKDIRTSELSACKTKDDCRLRWGSGCCQNCAGSSWDLIAYNKNVAFEQLVCDPAGDCPPCLPQPFPPGSSAECVAGHCQAAIPID